MRTAQDVMGNRDCHMPEKKQERGMPWGALMFGRVNYKSSVVMQRETSEVQPHESAIWKVR